MDLGVLIILFFGALGFGVWAFASQFTNGRRAP